MQLKMYPSIYQYLKQIVRISICHEMIYCFLPINKQIHTFKF